ncbi:hypothetical protein LTR49_008486 [Elasticomyces elasticus]|nr:hypothetical protein LTR49_008486 [Elasticomyces elasticus]KAK5762641.1 hypothetical protein LTS12_007231 [Elasticomyces elasticus]
MPTEEKRPRVSETSIVQAFSANEPPRDGAQKPAHAMNLANQLVRSAASRKSATRRCRRLQASVSLRERTHLTVVLEEDKGLMFLRKLKNIEVTLVTLYRIRSYDLTISRTDHTHKDQSFTKFERVGRSGITNQTEIMLVFKRAVEDMPAEENRPGVTETSIMRAIPVDEEFEAVVKERDTFASLPIQNCGLMSLLHANFILDGGRQDMLHNQEWNRRRAVFPASPKTSLAALQSALCAEEGLFVPDHDIAADRCTPRNQSGLPGLYACCCNGAWA